MSSLAMVDLIVLGIAAFLALRGWSKGLMRTIIGPLSLMIAIGGAIAYFNHTHNILYSTLITLFGPIVIAIILSIIVKIWSGTAGGNAPLAWPSRLTGSIFNLCWGGFFVGLFLVFLATLPLNIPGINNIKEKVATSHSYALVNRLFNNKIPYVRDVQDLLETSQDSKRLKEIQKTPEFEAIYRDDKIQDMLSDEKTAEQIKNQDMMKLLANPKMRSLLQDEELMKKIMELHTALQKEEPEPALSEPKVYEMEDGSARIIYK